MEFNNLTEATERAEDINTSYTALAYDAWTILCRFDEVTRNTEENDEQVHLEMRETCEHAMYIYDKLADYANGLEDQHFPHFEYIH